jgi:hypothetical protein
MKSDSEKIADAEMVSQVSTYGVLYITMLLHKSF